MKLQVPGSPKAATENKKNNAMITITPQGDVKITGGNSKNEIKFISLDGISYFTNKSEQFLDDMALI